MIKVFLSLFPMSIYPQALVWRWIFHTLIFEMFGHGNCSIQNFTHISCKSIRNNQNDKCTNLRLCESQEIAFVRYHATIYDFKVFHTSLYPQVMAWRWTCGRWGWSPTSCCVASRRSGAPTGTRRSCLSSSRRENTSSSVRTGTTSHLVSTQLFTLQDFSRLC